MAPDISFIITHMFITPQRQVLFVFKPLASAIAILSILGHHWDSADISCCHGDLVVLDLQPFHRLQQFMLGWANFKVLDLPGW